VSIVAGGNGIYSYVFGKFIHAKDVAEDAGEMRDYNGLCVSESPS